MATAVFADSSAPVRRAAQFLLESLGFEVAGARDADEALSLVRGLDPDLLILDARLPGSEGTSLVEAVRALAGGARPCLFFVTENCGPASVRAAMEAGADDYLIKPFDRELFAFKLTQARARGRLVEQPHPAVFAPRLVQDNSNSWRFRTFGQAG